MQLGRNPVMDLEDASAKAKFLIRDRDAKFTEAFYVGLNEAGLEVVKSGVRMPRMNSIMERWVGSVRTQAFTPRST
jgi:putative transposase